MKMMIVVDDPKALDGPHRYEFDIRNKNEGFDLISLFFHPREIRQLSKEAGAANPIKLVPRIELRHWATRIIQITKSLKRQKSTKVQTV